MPRRNNFIQQGELLSLILILGTFPDIGRKNHVTIYCDHVAVVNCMVNVSARAEDQNMLIGRAWLEVCKLDMGVTVCRVETHSNLADEPTRDDDCKLMKLLEAKWREARLPGWAQQVWSGLDFGKDAISTGTSN